MKRLALAAALLLAAPAAAQQRPEPPPPVTFTVQLAPSDQHTIMEALDTLQKAAGVQRSRAITDVLIKLERAAAEARKPKAPPADQTPPQPPPPPPSSGPNP